jgi:hypothetical protein
MPDRNRLLDIRAMVPVRRDTEAELAAEFWRAPSSKALRPWCVVGILDN